MLFVKKRLLCFFNFGYWKFLPRNSFIRAYTTVREYFELVGNIAIGH